MMTSPEALALIFPEAVIETSLPFRMMVPSFFRVILASPLLSVISSPPSISIFLVTLTCSSPDIALLNFKGSKFSYIVDFTPVRDILESYLYVLEEHEGVVAVADCPLFSIPDPNTESIRKIQKGGKLTVYESRSYDNQVWSYVEDEEGWRGWLPQESYTLGKKITRKKAGAESRVTAITCSSMLTEKRDKNMYQPVKAFDGKPETGWMESAKGSGKGEWIEIVFEKAVSADTIFISPGWFDKRYWGLNNRIKSMVIELDGEKYNVAFKDTMVAQEFRVPEGKTFFKAKFTIGEVYKSGKDDDSCIAEIEFKIKGQKIKLDISSFKEQMKAVPE
jgi:hypothetical protein